MKITSWNCRRMTSSATERALLDIQKQWGPDVLFLSETHLNTTKAGKSMRKLNMDGMEVVECWS